VIAQGLFSDAKDLGEIRMGDFRQISSYNSKMVQGKHLVSIEVE